MKRNEVLQIRIEPHLQARLQQLRGEMFRALWTRAGSIVALIVGLLKFT